MSRYKRHIFVCLNERPADNPRGCCLRKGSAEVRDLFKAELKKRGLTSTVRANNSGCLDACEHGITVVIYPEGIWYGGVKQEDVVEIIERTIIRGEVVQRLLIKDRRYEPDGMQFGPLDATDNPLEEL